MKAQLGENQKRLPSWRIESAVEIVSRKAISALAVIARWELPPPWHRHS
jgi:hypothetical protein